MSKFVVAAGGHMPLTGDATGHSGRFCLPGSLSARQAAIALVGVYEALAALPDKSQWCVQRTRRDHTGPRGAALATASTTLAALIDADPLHHDRHPYHNRQHFCEVMLAASVLADLYQLPADDAQLLLLAALAHDVVHDGGTGSGFRLERASVALALPCLTAAGVDGADCDRFCAMVLATEPVHGVAHAVAARRFHTAAGSPPAAPLAAPELSALCTDVRLSRLAGLLCEADVLPSVGLTFDYGLQVQHRLAREWGRQLAVDHKLAFVETVLACGVIGPFFATNAAVVQRELCAVVDAPEPR